jgi:hypothetical protein
LLLRTTNNAQTVVLLRLLFCAQLAQMINEKPQLINEYESGKAIPNPQVGGAARGVSVGRQHCVDATECLAEGTGCCRNEQLVYAPMTCWRAKCLKGCRNLF